MAAVELVDIVKTYGRVTAVGGVSLEIAQGEFVALLGPSGCGKTTTLQMLAGFTEPTSGDIRVDGVSVRGVPPHKRNVGVVFQSYALFPHLTVFDNVAFGLKMRKTPAADMARRVRTALDIVQLTDLDERYPRQLSGGQQQRVALARAMVIEPSLLLLDEPLSNLDANLREQMRFEIREIQKRIGITTIFVTHDQAEAMAAADRLVVMKGGTIRQAGTVRQIYEQPADPYVASFIGNANLVPGTVVGVEKGLARIRIGDGQDVLARTVDGASAGADAILVLRPEDLRIGEEAGPETNSVVGEVTRGSFLGNNINVGVRIGDLTVSVIAERHKAIPAAGDRITLSWARSSAVLFAGERL